MTEAVVRSVHVATPPEKAFELFTAGMTRWWNPEYTIGEESYDAVVVEPRQGGRWYERTADGVECEWGQVLAWEPPHRVVLTWQVSADWTYDPDLVTELEVRFTRDGEGTRVVLEHRGLEAYGDRGPAMREVFAGPDGWGGLLGRLRTETT